MQIQVNGRYEIAGSLFGLVPDCNAGLFLRVGNLEAWIDRVSYGGKRGDFGNAAIFERWEDCGSLHFRLFTWHLILDIPPKGPRPRPSLA